MKKTFLFVISMIILTGMAHKAQAITFEEAAGDVDVKPVLVYITAPWIENADTYEAVYKKAEQNLQNQYNVVRLDITSNDFKYFNKKYQLYQNLPYDLLFKNQMKISRYMQKDCIKDYACLEGRAKEFLH